MSPISTTPSEETYRRIISQVPPFFLSSLVFPLWGASEHRLSVRWKTIKQASRHTESQERKRIIDVIAENKSDEKLWIWMKVIHIQEVQWIPSKTDSKIHIKRHNKIAQDREVNTYLKGIFKDYQKIFHQELRRLKEVGWYKVLKEEKFN